MAKIVYLGIPAHGHTNPTLPVVRELVARGHDVLYYNAESFRNKIEPTGVDFRAYPEPLPTEREVAEALTRLIDASLIMSRFSEQLTPFALDEIRREQPDLILYDSVAMWGYIAARTLGIPHICLLTHFVLDGSQNAMGWGTLARFMVTAIPHIPTLIGWKRRMIGRYGKANVGGLTEYGDRNIVFTSRTFHPVNRSLDDRFRFAGPSIAPSVRENAAPLDLPTEGRVIYISLGTINHLDTAFYQAAFEAFAGYDAHFILSVGKHTDIGVLTDIPDNFTVRPFVPQLDVLQRADAFITHGGMNSVHEGLVYGVPLVVVHIKWSSCSTASGWRRRVRAS